MKQVTRQAANEPYHFIRLSMLKACTTNDLYFDSDNEKYATGNYFLSIEQAKRCASELQEDYGEELQTIEHKRAQYRDILLKAVREIAADCKFARIGNWEAAGQQPELTKVVEGAALIGTKVYEFEADNRVLSKRAAEIREDVLNRIANYPKI